MLNPHELPRPQLPAGSGPPQAPDIPGLEFVRVIGQGGHATVYLARQLDHDRQVAVKVLDAELDDTARRRFDRERATLGRVSTHPGVVGLFDSGIARDGRAYLVLEWAPGGSLADHLENVGTMPISEVTELGICLAGALEQAHRSGVMHRDIKPGNVVRSAFGDWLLTDFSVAAFMDPALATHAVHVSLAHCPPEAFDRREPAASADVYSLASVLRAALTGEEPNAPRPGDGVAATIAKICSVAMPPLTASVAGAEVVGVINAATDLDPARRPQTMRTFAQQLSDVRNVRGLAPVTFRVGSDVTLPVSNPSAAHADRQPLTPPPAPSSLSHVSTRRPTTGRIARLIGAAAVLAGLLIGGLGTAAAIPSNGIMASIAAASVDITELDITELDDVVSEVAADIATDEPAEAVLDVPVEITADADATVAFDGGNNGDGRGDGNGGRGGGPAGGGGGGRNGDGGNGNGGGGQ